jgi:hypothetical protein
MKVRRARDTEKQGKAYIGCTCHNSREKHSGIRGEVLYTSMKIRQDTRKHHILTTEVFRGSRIDEPSNPEDDG